MRADPSGLVPPTILPPRRRRDHRVRLAITCGAAACLAVASGVVWLTGATATDAAPIASVGQRPAATVGDTAAIPLPTGPPTASAQSLPEQPEVSASDGAIASARVVVPAALLLPDLARSATVVPVGVADDGQVVVPRDGDVVGWYRFGAGPADASGSVVVVGHRDTRAEGPGVLYALERSQVGDVIELVGDDWSIRTYRVVSREAFTKRALPTEELFRESGPSVLTVITCGGSYTPGVGYEQNVVVTAVPDGPPRVRT